MISTIFKYHSLLHTFGLTTDFTKCSNEERHILSEWPSVLVIVIISLIFIFDIKSGSHEMISTFITWTGIPIPTSKYQLCYPFVCQWWLDVYIQINTPVSNYSIACNERIVHNGHLMFKRCDDRHSASSLKSDYVFIVSAQNLTMTCNYSRSFLVVFHDRSRK